MSGPSHQRIKVCTRIPPRIFNKLKIGRHTMQLVKGRLKRILTSGAVASYEISVGLLLVF